jgi:hypothetical protein
VSVYVLCLAVDLAQSFSSTHGVQLQQVIDRSTGVRALTILNNELFVITDKHSQQVNVYESRDKFTLTRHIQVPDMKNPRSIAASDRHQCLYIGDTALPYVVHVIDVRNSSYNKWSLSAEPYGVSVTSDNNVLVTLYRAKVLEEYTTDGALIRQIKLDDSIDGVHHSVQLSTGQFVVSHGYNNATQPRVVIVDESGRVVKSYGG